ncbi:hypothetical protein R1flu_025909 [Riccia fluitans]|uniref:C2H2-type domain-containing protein n=1 Tax=Riccia fluitans TaxID=41844 RepID=A0ABD1XZ99_9MARC
MKGVGKSRLIVYLFELLLQVLFTLYLLLHLFIVLARRKGNDDESQHSLVPPAGERAEYDFNGLIGFKEGDTLLSLLQKLEGTRIFESEFHFWDSRLGSPVHMKLEALIFVEDLEGKVVLFETKDSEESNLVLVGPRVEIEPPVIGTLPKKCNIKEQNEGIVDVLIGLSEPSVIGDDRPDRGEEKVAVQNVFINYRNKHIGCEKHVANWRRCRNLPLNVGKKKTPEPQVNHRAETDAACAIVEKVNGEELSQKKPFVIEGDVKREPCYSWIFKVQCVYCGSKFELVPSKRNLEHNLREHLSSEKHRENVEFQLCSTSHCPIRSGAKRRPKKFDPRDLKRQRCIDSFFVGAQSSGNVSNPSSTEDCKKEPEERLHLKDRSKRPTLAKYIEIKVDDKEDAPGEKNKKEEREPRKTLLEVLLEHFISDCQHAKNYRQRLEEGIENPLGDKDTHLRMFVSDQYPDPLQGVCFKDDVQYLDLTTFPRQAYTLAVADVP